MIRVRYTIPLKVSERCFNWPACHRKASVFRTGRWSCKDCDWFLHGGDGFDDEPTQPFVRVPLEVKS